VESTSKLCFTLTNSLVIGILLAWGSFKGGYAKKLNRNKKRQAKCDQEHLMHPALLPFALKGSNSQIKVF